MGAVRSLNPTGIADGIIRELEDSKRRFHDLTRDLSGEDLRRQSFNPGWTNGEIFAHILFGYIILNALLPLVSFFTLIPPVFGKAFAGVLDFFAGPFNGINALGARGQGIVFKGDLLVRWFDGTVEKLVRKARATKEFGWSQGMYYPVKWDPNFDAFMTREKLFRYSTKHFGFHVNQIRK